MVKIVPFHVKQTIRGGAKRGVGGMPLALNHSKEVRYPLCRWLGVCRS